MLETENISVREFKSADLAAVGELICATIDACYTRVYPKEAVKFFKNWHCDENILKGAREGYATVLERDGRIIGTGTLLGDEIVRVFVDAGFQKCGLGKLIMQRLEEKAVSLGIPTVRLHASLPSKKFYDGLGYKTLEKSFIRVEDDERLDYYRMEKALMKRKPHS